MAHFHRILLHAGLGPGAEAAIEEAVRLAARTSTPLRVVEVVEAAPAYARRFLPGDLLEMVEQQHRVQLDAILARCGREGIQATGEILRGRPASVVGEEVVRGGHDLVVRGDKGRAGRKRRSFGPADLELLRECPCAVWMVRPPADVQYGCVVAAVDPEALDAEAEALNRRIVEVALDMSIVEESALLLLSVWSPYGESLLKSRLSAEEFRGWQTRVRTEAKTALDRLCDSFGPALAKAERHLAKGDPSQVIPRFANRHDATLLVMGTVGRTGVPGLVMGNTAERVLREVDCDVLTMKPGGFRALRGPEPAVGGRSA